MTAFNAYKSDFYLKARKHQIDFKENVLGIKRYDGNDVVLVYDDAIKGLNFYSPIGDIFDAVKHRFKNRYKTPLYANMLRSEHIPFNLFAPLKSRVNDKLTVKFLNEVFHGTDISQVKDILIEHAPRNKKRYLNDNTSFDTYIFYENSKNEKCGLGIEVKYTERSYPFGNTERERMRGNEQNSLYHSTHNDSGIYTDNSIKQLATIPLKQFWRNHLLGLKMAQKGDIKNFFSAHIFPAGNTYQKEKSEEYSNQIKSDFRYQFIPVTYETFIDKLILIFREDRKFLDWANYLRSRYIVSI